MLGLLCQTGHAITPCHCPAIPHFHAMPTLACRLQSWRQRQQNQVKQHKEMHSNIQAAKESLVKLMG